MSLKKILIYSIPLLFLLGTIVVMVFSNALPYDTKQEIFFWIILYSSVVVFFYLKITSLKFLFTGLFIITVGGVLSIFNAVVVSELALRLGYVFLLEGGIVGLFETFKNEQKK